MTPTSTADDLDLDHYRAAAVAALKAYLAEPDDRARTQHLRAAAQAVVGARSGMVDRTGRTDWTGRSWEYRQFVRAVADEAGVAPGERGRLFGAMRWHAGAAVREIAGAEELEGRLLPGSPAERDRAARAERAEVYHRAKVQGQH